MDVPTLERFGLLLVGADWQRPLARLLGPRHPDGARESIDDRLVRRWYSGDRPIPAWVGPALADLLDEQAKHFAASSRMCGELAVALRNPEEPEFHLYPKS
jgi:hypothetical protein